MITLEEFIETNETVGWDASVDYITRNTSDQTLHTLAYEYYRGYDYCEDNDVDGGRCFEVRAKAIGDIIEYLQGECSVDN